MSNYRRATSTGACYFFTVVTHQRKPIFNNDITVQILRKAMHNEIQRRPFVIEAAVILPNHIHCLWQLPENDSDFSSRWREIKKAVTRHISETTNTGHTSILWQPRFWEHKVRDEHDWRMHMDYIHYNPVKHGYVTSPSQWPWSSFNHWVAKGAYDSNWGSSEPSDISKLNFE